jgi:hypothetical protein
MPKLFHVAQQVVAASFADDLPQDVPEQPNVAPHGFRHLQPVAIPVHRLCAHSKSLTEPTKVYTFAGVRT